MDVLNSSAKWGVGRRIRSGINCFTIRRQLFESCYIQVFDRITQYLKNGVLWCQIQ